MGNVDVSILDKERTLKLILSSGGSWIHITGSDFRLELGSVQNENGFVTLPNRKIIVECVGSFGPEWGGCTASKGSVPVRIMKY